MPLELRDNITRAKVRAEPNTLFVFGDNMVHRGMAGQAAAMRGEPNAVGLPTKWEPTNKKAAYFKDGDLSLVQVEAEPAIFRLRMHAQRGGLIVWPAGGIGTGHARLAEKAPKILAFYTEIKRNLEKL